VIQTGFYFVRITIKRQILLRAILLLWSFATEPSIAVTPSLFSFLSLSPALSFSLYLSATAFYFALNFDGFNKQIVLGILIACCSFRKQLASYLTAGPCSNFGRFSFALSHPRDKLCSFSIPSRSLPQRGGGKASRQSRIKAFGTHIKRACSFANRHAVASYRHNATLALRDLTRKALAIGLNTQCPLKSSRYCSLLSTF